MLHVAPDPVAAPAAVAHHNVVVLVGRVSADPEPKELPKGDQLLEFRLVVEREQPDGRGRRTHDTIRCEVATSSLRRSVGRWRKGDVVEVSGAIRRRFIRGTPGASVHVVAVDAAHRLQRAALA